MKKFAKNYFFSLLIIFFSTFISCDLAPDFDNFGSDFGNVGCLGCGPISVTKEELTNAATQGTWRITYYWNKDHEETTNFVGYNFTFKSNNIVWSNNSTNNYIGNWNVTEYNVINLQFNFAFESPLVLKDIPDNWKFESLQGNELRLSHVIESENKAYIITFTKN